MTSNLRCGEPSEVGMDPARLALIRQRGAEWVETGRAASLTLLIARRGAVVLHEAFGRVGPEPDASRLPLDAIYPLASITKPMTAALVMQLVEDGLLGLNRPVQEYVPEFAGEGKEAVMVHHLLTHTSGLTPEGIAAHGQAKIDRGDWVPNDRVKGVVAAGRLGLITAPELYDAPPSCPPGKQMSYCNLGYRVLAEIVERLRGKLLGEVAQERIFAPLGMKDTSIGLDPGRHGRFVRRAADDAYAVLNDPNRATMIAGAGGVNATAPDVARFGQAFLAGGRPILSPASVAAMTRDQTTGIDAVYGAERFTQAGWGYGWGLQLEKKNTNHPALLSSSAFGHSGAGGPALFVDPPRELVLAYLSVELGATPGGVKQWVFDHFGDMAIAAIND